MDSATSGDPAACLRVSWVAIGRVSDEGTGMGGRGRYRDSPPRSREGRGASFACLFLLVLALVVGGVSAASACCFAPPGGGWTTSGVLGSSHATHAKQGPESEPVSLSDASDAAWAVDAAPDGPAHCKDRQPAPQAPRVEAGSRRVPLAHGCVLGAAAEAGAGCASGAGVGAGQADGGGGGPPVLLGKCVSRT